MKKWLLIPISSVLMVGCTMYSNGNPSRTSTQSQPHPRYQQSQNWSPRDRFEKSCYSKGLKPGTEQFKVCVEEERRFHSRKKGHDEAVMERKRGQEIEMEKRERREKTMVERKERQQEMMHRKAEQQKAMEWKREQMKKKPYVKKPFK